MSSGPQSIALMVALYHFKAESEPEISMQQNEFIEMLDMDPALNGWAFARRKRDGKEGYVPISYLGTNNNKDNDHHQGNNLSQQSNPMNRSHKHSKTGNQSRSASPNPNKARDDKNNYNNSGYPNRNKFGDKGSNRNNFNNQNQQNYGQNTDPNQGGSNKGKYSSQINNENDNNGNKGGGGDNNNKSNNNSSSNSSANNNNNNPNGSSSNNNNNNNGADARQIICSFHRDFIPDMNDLYKYFEEFGKVVNKIEIEYDSKKVPLAKIKFQTADSVNKVCDKGNRQQIPSGQQNGTIHIRVYRSMQDYINNGQRSNRGPYKHKSSRRGGF